MLDAHRRARPDPLGRAGPRRRHDRARARGRRRSRSRGSGPLVQAASDGRRSGGYKRRRRTFDARIKTVNLAAPTVGSRLLEPQPPGEPGALGRSERAEVRSVKRSGHSVGLALRASSAPWWRSGPPWFSRGSASASGPGRSSSRRMSSTHLGDGRRRGRHAHAGRLPVLEIGFSRQKNVGTGVAKILINFAIAAIAWWIGRIRVRIRRRRTDSSAPTGSSSTTTRRSDRGRGRVPSSGGVGRGADDVLHARFCAVSLAIVWGTTLERIKFGAYVIYAIVFSGADLPDRARTAVYGGGFLADIGRQARHRTSPVRRWST